MKHSNLVSAYTYEANAGSSIWSTVEELLLQPRHGDVFLRFNDTKLRIYPGSCAEDIFEKYSLAAQLANKE